MKRILGLDIGGANIKVAFLRLKEGSMEGLKTNVRYFPIWKEGKEKLKETIESAILELDEGMEFDAVAVTMTAELSDVYFSKREGVDHILQTVQQVFPSTPTFVLDVNSKLLSVEEARERPYEVAAANWVATGWMVSRFVKDCIVIDVGSTTTSTIPIIGGKIAAEGKNDVEKLMNGELIYTGSLRTNIATIAHSVPYRGQFIRLSSEKFALSGDVHLVLGNISREQYTTETADGRGRTRLETMARIARAICADMNMISEQDVLCIAEYIAEKQVEQIVSGLKQVYERTREKCERFAAVVTGLGKDFLARKAAEQLEFDRVIDVEELVEGGSLASPAVGIAMMLADKLREEGAPNS